MWVSKDGEQGGSKTIVIKSEDGKQVFVVRSDGSEQVEIVTSSDAAGSEKQEKQYPATVPQKDRELLFGDHTADPTSMKFRPGKGLEITSKNDKFKIVPRLRIQFRSESQSQRLEGEEPDLTTSFQLRRARLQFAGHVFGKHNKYKAEFAFSPRDLGYRDGALTRTPMLTWYAEFDYLWWATLRVGQYKIPYSRQRVVSSGNLELVDRTMANGEFNLDRDIGFDIRAKGKGGWKERFRYYAGVYVGEGRDGFQTESLRTSPGGGLMYLGRVEVLPFGSFKDYSEVDFARTRKPRLSLGGGYAYLDKAKKNRGILGSTPADGGTTDYHNANADFMFKYAGLTVFGEFYWRKGTRVPGDATELDDLGIEVPVPVASPRNGIGFSAQAGYLIPRTRLGVAARYSQARGIGDDTSLTDKDEIGGGLGYYFAGHPLKLQLDYFHQRPQGMDGGAVDMLRIQLQLAY